MFNCIVTARVTASTVVVAVDKVKIHALSGVIVHQPVKIQNGKNLENFKILRQLFMIWRLLV